MFIKEIKKKNQGSETTFLYHRLIESYRTERGPRQRTVINLGKLDIPKEHWKILADRIEDKITGQSSFVAIDEKIEGLAGHYANLIIQKRLTVDRIEPEKDQQPPDYETVDLNSVTTSKSRTIGAECVGLSMFRKLGFEKLFRRLGLSQSQCHVAALSILGRLVHPGSERRTRQWAQHLSGLDELLGTDFSHLSNNALYRISDLLLDHKDRIEEHLKVKERTLFSLQEKIILYDLTNTYFEGTAKKNPKAKRARSKEKRSDCPLVTLGLVIDELGFPKRSKIFRGNVSEPKTLEAMIESLQGENDPSRKTSENKQDCPKAKKGITVVLDAGIAVEENLTYLKGEGYDYICVARNKPVDPAEVDGDSLVTIKQDKNNKVEAALIKRDGESILYCKSFLKAQKEQAMKTRFQERFEQGLEEITAALSKKRGTKKYDKVLGRISRHKEKYASIARYYKIDVRQKDGIVPAGGITWSMDKREQAEERFSGTYFLRTTRTELDEKEIWSLYVMLTHVEDAFRYLKSDLDLRPIFHQKEDRTEGHLFITILAYHLLVSIQTELKKHGIDMRWWQVRELLSSHVRITTSMRNKEGKQIHVRTCTEPETFHRSIYNALKLKHSPLGAKRTKI
jgi:transposase